MCYTVQDEDSKNGMSVSLKPYVVRNVLFVTDEYINNGVTVFLKPYIVPNMWHSPR